MSSSGFCYSSRPLNENKRKWKDKQTLEPYQRTENTIEHENDCDINCSWCPWNGPQRLRKETGETRGQKKKSTPTRLEHSWDQQEYLEELWRPEEAWSLSDFREKPLVKTGLRKLDWMKTLMIVES